MEETLLVGLAAIVVLAVGSQIVAARLRLPSILVLLVAGIVVGPVTGALDPDALLGELIFPVTSLAVAIILFEGGLLLDLGELRGGVSKVVRRLLVVGLLVTAAGGALGARYILGLDPEIAAVLGAILTVSGPTVVLPLLRFIRPSKRVAAVLKWEGIFVDALGAALAILVFEAVLATGAAPGMLRALPGVGLTLLVGGLVGAAGAGLLVVILRSEVTERSFDPATTIMLVLTAFTAADLLRAESGLFAAVVMGMVLANQDWVAVHRIEEFKESLGPLLTGALFIILSARLDLDELIDVLPQSLALIAVLVLVVRPVAAWLSTIRSTLAGRERAVIAWMYPRGIVAAATASVFAFRLEEAGIAGADTLAPVTFLVILGTVAIYGLTGAPVARALKVSADARLRVLVVGTGTTAGAVAVALTGLDVDMTTVTDVEASMPMGEDGRLEVDWAVVVGPDPTLNRACSTYLAERMAPDRVRELAVTSRPSPEGWTPDPPFGPAITYELLGSRVATREVLRAVLTQAEADATPEDELVAAFLN